MIAPPAARPYLEAKRAAYTVNGALAQSVEHRTFNPLVDGSIPSRPIPTSTTCDSAVGVVVRII